MNSKEKAKDIRLFKTYGITYKDWLKMEKQQQGKCWICQQVPKKYLCVDHRHVHGYKKMSPEDKKKEVRKLLCFQCNVALGKLEKRKESRFILSRIVEYFKQHKIKGDV